MYSVQCKLLFFYNRYIYSVQCIVYSVSYGSFIIDTCTVYSVQCKLRFFLLYIHLQCTVYSVQCKLPFFYNSYIYSVQCIVYSVQCKLRLFYNRYMYSAQCIVYSVLYGSFIIDTCTVHSGTCRGSF